MMKLAIRFLLSLAAATVAGSAYSQDTDDALQLYAVHIDRTQMTPLNGYGVYLGNGFVITAAHVVGGGDATKPQVKIGGERLPTRVVKDGDLNDVDLTLLSVDVRQLPASLASAHMPLCQNPPAAGESVIVATPEGVARSYIMSPSLLPATVPAKFRTVRYIAETGNSGAGVFDAKAKCLLGIISRRISGVLHTPLEGQVIEVPVNVAKYYVPVSEIAKFIPPDIRF
jgi:trypsin-like peptidase